MNPLRLILLTLLVIPLLPAGVTLAYTHQPGDFATEVVEYLPGTGITSDRITGKKFNDPNVALGRPTVDSTGDNWTIPLSQPVPVNPLYPPFRSSEVVTVGLGGRLILKFDHPVANDDHNPYGIDFIIFGNSMSGSASGRLWDGGDPAGFSLTAATSSENGTVSVSQDGIVWHTFTQTWADGFAPTLGRIYDPNHPDPALGNANQWWSGPTNPTLPLDPAITPATLAGKTLARTARLFGHSAGGTGFDLDRLAPPLAWFQYLKIIDSGNAPEIDAVADVTCCGDWRHPTPAGDLDGNCRVDTHDLRLLAESWLEPHTQLPNEANLDQLAGLSANWFTCTWECP